MTDILDNWEVDPEAYTNASLEDLKFVFSQAEKRVDQTSNEGDVIYTKSITIISISLTLITGLVAFGVSKDATIRMQLLSFTCGAPVLTSFYLLCKNIFPSRYRGVGSHPRHLFVKDFFLNLGNRTPEWYMLMNEIALYEERLSLNIKSNNERNERLSHAYVMLYSVPPMALIGYLFSFLYNI